MLVCDEGGSVEWAIGLSDVREFTVDVSDLYGDQGCVVVAVQVKR
ncbi:MAG TPA: hypothetical protein VFY10_09495 [Dehalococcoidia bacterium]|nr:hypothetical protein [Dehalococcoidia bacterium]